jgi:hypothetical protein
MLEKSLSERAVVAVAVPEGAAYVLGLVAQDVQDAVQDTIGRWPRCTSCDVPRRARAAGHPELGDDPKWLCESSASSWPRSAL